MLCTIEIGTCVWVQGELVQMLDNGQIVIRDGAKLYRGHRVEGREPARRLDAAAPPV